VFVGLFVRSQPVQGEDKEKQMSSVHTVALCIPDRTRLLPKAVNSRVPQRVICQSIHCVRVTSLVHSNLLFLWHAREDESGTVGLFITPSKLEDGVIERYVCGVCNSLCRMFEFTGSG
jgi:hypothetical protein